MGSPRDPDGRAFAPLADAYRRAGDFRQALELLRHGLERHPDFVAGHLVAAQVYLEKGLVEEAEIAARRAVELDGENPLAWSFLADALEARGAMALVREARARVAQLEGTDLSEEAVLDVAELAPEDGVLEIAALAPEEAVHDVAELAPDGGVLEIAALAPEEPVLDVAELAPEDGVLEIAALAPEEPVLDVAALAPEEGAFELFALGSDAGEAAAGDFPSDELLRSEPLVTRTMAELYARQGLTERALVVLRQLLEASPGDAELLLRVRELEGASGAHAPEREGEPVEPDHPWTGAAAEYHGEVETPFAWTAQPEREEAGAPDASAGSYFQRILAWEPRSGKGEA